MSSSQFESAYKKFETPTEEVEFLQGRTRERAPEGHESLERATAETLKEYEEATPDHVLDDEYLMTVNEIEETVLHLSKEHDRQIDELALLLEEKGIKNTITIVQKMNNPHLADDFHRFLVQYLARVGHIEGLKEGSALFKALDMKLYEVTLPRSKADGTERSFAELVAAMEQFYAGMLAISGQRALEKNHFTFEIALSNFSEEVIFYCAVPLKKSGVFEKQLLGVFPTATVREHQEDYNPFQEGGAHAGSVARLSRLPVFPLKTYRNFENDPLNVILQAFDKIKRDGEGAAIQLVFSPRGETYNNQYAAILEKVRKGASVKEAYEAATASIGKEFLHTAKDILFGSKPKKQSTEQEPIDERTLQMLADKLSSPIVEANIRLVASAEEYGRAEAILSELEAAFSQFREADSNSLDFKRATSKALIKLIHAFSFRLFKQEEALPLNLAELTTMFHVPISATASGALKHTKAKTAPPPLSIAKDGILLGVNEHQGARTDIRIAAEDRMRHFYVIGQTGTGKTTLLKNMIIQDIQNGEGVCMIDPHGSDVEDILANIPSNRVDDVIYFDPADTSYPMGLNMLEYDHNRPEQKTFVVNELFSIFEKLYGGNPESMGPMFEQYFRNATMLVVEDPQSGSTLLEVSRVMSDARFRELKLSRCKNLIVTQFWEEIASKAGGEAALANIVPYITSKFDIFLANDIMRPIVAQEHSAFDFRQIMDERKILLVNLAKGRLGEVNAHLLGLILVGKILMAALSRVDAADRPDFHLYIDEFQNITTNSIATILSEARKYRLGLNIAHQFIDQLDEKTKNAVFGNVGSMAIFRTGAEDTKFLESQFTPTFSADDIIHLENRHAYLKLLVNGYPERPFNIETVSPKTGTPETVAKLKELSALRYGIERAQIEDEIMRRYKTNL